MLLLKYLHSRHEAGLIAAMSIHEQHLINAVVYSGKRGIYKHGGKRAYAQRCRAWEIHMV